MSLFILTYYDVCTEYVCLHSCRVELDKQAVGRVWRYTGGELLGLGAWCTTQVLLHHIIIIILTLALSRVNCLIEFFWGEGEGTTLILSNITFD